MTEQACESVPARTFLQPIALPSALGLFGFAGSTFIVAAHLAHWYGDPKNHLQTFMYLAPFCFAFGGVAQFAAAMWAFKARDTLASAIHGTWGAFWIGFGILIALLASGAMPATPVLSVAFGYWFIALAVITLAGAIVAMGENLGLAAVLHTLWIGSALLAIALTTGAPTWEVIGGWFLIISSAIATYTATAMMAEAVLGRPVLPVGETQSARTAQKVDSGAGEPGVAKGQ